MKVDGYKIIEDLLPHVAMGSVGTEAYKAAWEYLKEERPKRLIQQARDIVADECALKGNHPDYIQYMREGAYDDDIAVQATLRALMLASLS